MRKIPFIILIISILMIGIGISNGEMTMVFNKAVQVCFECIGVG